MIPVFVEASQRVLSVLSNLKIPDIMSHVRKITELPVKHGKNIMYYVVSESDVIIIDETFDEMFTTAYFTISGLPHTFIGPFHDYVFCVFLLYRQMKWSYEERDLYLAPFRKEIIEKIININERELTFRSE